MNNIKDQENINQKIILLRLDLNVPLKNGSITDETRINKIIPILLLCVFLSNFIDLKFYEVDKINSATEIYFSLDVGEGFFLEDYMLRNEIAGDKSFHYKNSQITLYDAWSKGCPNQ